MESVITDPRVQALLNPVAVAFLMLVTGGLVQATRALRIDSRWLPWVSAGCGVFVLAMAVMAISGGAAGLVGSVVLLGLGVGLGITGGVTITNHWGTGSTDGSSTAKQP